MLNGCKDNKKIHFKQGCLKITVYPVSWMITAVMMLGLYFWRTRKLLAQNARQASMAKNVRKT